MHEQMIAWIMDDSMTARQYVNRGDLMTDQSTHTYTRNTPIHKMLYTPREGLHPPGEQLAGVQIPKFGGAIIGCRHGQLVIKWVALQDVHLGLVPH